MLFFIVLCILLQNGMFVNIFFNRSSAPSSSLEMGLANDCNLRRERSLLRVSVGDCHPTEIPKCPRYLRGGDIGEQVIGQPFFVENTVYKLLNTSQFMASYIN